MGYHHIIAALPLARFAVALVAVAIASLARAAMTPLLGYRFQFLTFFPAILVSAWYGGFWPGVFATVLSAGAISVIWLQPTWAFDVADAGDLVAVSIFLGVGLAISAVHESLRRERAALTAARVTAERAAAAAQRAGREADRANRAKDEFLSILSHELRTPLTAILGWSAFLRTRAPDGATSARGLAAIERNSLAQARLIEDLFDVSSIVTGKLRLDLRLICPVTVLRAALEQLNPAIQAKRLSLVTTIDPDPSLIRADPDRLQQIVWNLLSNAIKFTPPSGRITVKLARSSSHLEIRVADTGQGIPTDFLPYVFDRFRQADSSSTRAHHGLGLGLSLVKYLVEMHGGTVTAQSEGPGLGAELIVSLPVPPALPGPDDAPAVSGAEPAELGAVSLNGVRVLVVDDELDTLDMVAAILRERGARVSVATSTAEALAVLKSELIDVLVSDLAMPGEDGYALLEQASELLASQHRRVPALALTAYASSADVQRAYRAGFQVHLPKPVTPQRLVGAVARLAPPPGSG
jgi:signal transduction histidine kinase